MKRSVINKVKHNLLHLYQRTRRGYSDCDMWNADKFLAEQIANTLDWIVEKGIGVSLFYGYGLDPINHDVDVMVKRRDIDYKKYSAIFREYSINGPAMNKDWKDESGGVLDNEMHEALQWLVEHFQELWD